MALGTDAVEFVEQINGASLRDRIKDEAKLSGSLSHETGDQAIETYSKEGKRKLAGNGRGSHGLTRARRPDQEELFPRHKAVRAYIAEGSMFANDPIKNLSDL